MSSWLADIFVAMFADWILFSIPIVCIRFAIVRRPLNKTTATWLERFAGKFPAAPVNDLSAALENPLVRDEGRLRDYAHHSGGKVRMVAGPVLCPGDEAPARAAPALGADSEALLRELGYGQEGITKLRDAGAI